MLPPFHKWEAGAQREKPIPPPHKCLIQVSSLRSLSAYGLAPSRLPWSLPPWSCTTPSIFLLRGTYHTPYNNYLSVHLYPQQHWAPRGQQHCLALLYSQHVLCCLIMHSRDSRNAYECMREWMDGKDQHLKKWSIIGKGPNSEGILE